MSLFYGKRWKINGVAAGPINRIGPTSSEYCILFERDYASLEDIESIDWGRVTLEYIGSQIQPEPGLPAGYGFEVVKIEYSSNTRTYEVRVKTAQQYWGDVTGYQEQIAGLESAAAEKDSTISVQAAQIHEQVSIIEEQAATIQTLREAGSAVELQAELDAAYEEGVSSVE